RDRPRGPRLRPLLPGPRAQAGRRGRRRRSPLSLRPPRGAPAEPTPSVDASNALGRGRSCILRAVSSDLVGESLGGYLLEAKIGAGATGVVYRATDAAGRPVAIKVLNQNLGQI